jgi:hypothetical protein
LEPTVTQPAPTLAPIFDDDDDKRAVEYRAQCADAEATSRRLGLVTSKGGGWMATRPKGHVVHVYADLKPDHAAKVHAFIAALLAKVAKS